MDIGNRIKELREEADISQAELARRIGISRNGMNRIERGFNMPKAENLSKLAKVLGVPVSALFETPRTPSVGPPMGGFRMREYYGEESEYGAFEDYIQTLDLEQLANLGRSLMVQHRMAYAMGDLDEVAEIDSKRARVARRLRSLKPPLYSVSGRYGEPIKVTYYLEPSEEERAEVRERFGEVIEDRELLALAAS